MISQPEKKIAVIVLNYNGQKYLPDLFSSLKTTKYPSDKWKLVFVDNNSSDTSYEFAQEKYPFAHFIKNQENLGFTEGNNVGVRWALKEKYDYIVLLNQDTIVTGDWLNILLNTIESNPQIGAVQPKILLHPETEKINNLGNKIHYLGFGYGDYSEKKDKENYQNIREINYCSGACVMIRSEIIEKIGLFDPEMFLDLEDLDFGWRLKLFNYQNIIDEQAKIYHKYTFSSTKARFYHTEKNRWIVFYKNYRLATKIVLLPMFLIMELGLILYALKGGWIDKKIKSYFYFLKPQTWKYLHRSRQKVNSIRRLKDIDLLRSFTAEIKFQAVDNFLLRNIGNPLMKLYYQISLLIIKW